MSGAAGTNEEEATYYQTIEEAFVEGRGDPLFLSNADWLLVRRWRRSGIPLRIVLRGIADALDAHAHSWGRHRKVASLAYCRDEVESAFERWQRALAMGEDAGLDVPGILEGLARQLDTAVGLGERGLHEARRVVEGLRERAAGSGGGAAGLDAWLAEAESRLLAAIVADAAPGIVRATEAAVEDDLAPYAGRMPARVLEQIREDAVKRRLLEGHGLPRLSLFHVS